METPEGSETETNKGLPETDSRVSALQAVLFPPQLTTSGSYFSTFFIKNQVNDEEEPRYMVKESYYKDWFSFNKDLDFTLQPPRWPTECQVLEERVQHINNVPMSFEPYYAITGNECQPKPTGDECGLIVYQYIPISAVNYFSRSSTGGSKYLLSTNLCPEEDTLRFESRFESGNLARAIMITPNYYELHLRSDLYTSRHMQWFYFKITNTKKESLYRFSITNCSKEGSLYNEGMKPLMYSTKDASLHSIGWRRCGQNVTYFCNDNGTTEDPDQQVTYTLSFTVQFPHDDDEVYFAHSYPYTYSDLQDYLSELSSHPVKSSFSTVRLLCKSLAGNNIYYVTVTTPNVAENKKKKAIVITARVHPGETPSSWVMKGFLDFLTGDSSAAKELRDKFVFKLVPMLNPDGVIVGNNRCSLSAKDLNRQYRTVIRDAYPSIWYTKLMVRRLLEECGVAMYCDLHAHSRRHNMFIYGCESRRCSEKKLQEQVFPLMLRKNAADKFSFESCKFRIHKTKEGTGRVVMWMMGIVNSFTMEASFCGSTLGNRVETHFTTQDYEQMGKTFCETLLDYYDEDSRKAQLRSKILDKLAKEGSNADEPTNICLSDYSSDEGDTSTSDEVGKDDDIIVPIVPPPSPLIEIKKTKPKTTRKQKSNAAPKSASITRKPLPICKATLKLSLSEKESSSSGSSSSDSEFDDAKSQSTRRKKKYPKKKKSNQDYSDGELQLRRSQRSVSVFDLVPTDMLKSQLFTRRSKTPQPRTIAEKKCSIAKQLTEVQAKLTSLKNKLWFGTGNGDGPLSSEKKNNCIPHTDVPQQKRKSHKKHKKQTNKQSEKNVEAKSKSQQYGLPAENPIRLSLQTTISTPICDDVRNFGCGSDTACPDVMRNKLPVSVEASSYVEERRDRKKKKKSRRFAKKAKLINNVKVFTRKD